MPAFVAFLPGMIAGSLCTSLITHWVALLLSGWQRNPIDAPLPTSGRVWARVFTVVHPIPWVLILGIPYGIHRFLTNPPTMGWRWFLGGMLFAILGTYVAVWTVILRRRKKSAAALNDPATRGDNVA